MRRVARLPSWTPDRRRHRPGHRRAAGRCPPRHQRSATPPPIELRAGVAHRFRFINISPLESHTVQLVSGGAIQQWRAVAKDGADLLAHQATAQPGVVALHPGETYDFEVTHQVPESLTLKISSPETITNRLAARARGVARDALPRIVTEIPVVVRQ